MADTAPLVDDATDNTDFAAIIREKTGKPRLSFTSLRSVGVADLRETAAAVKVAEHKTLKKTDLIQALLRKGEQSTLTLKVEPRMGMGVNADPDCEDGTPADEPEQEELELEAYQEAEQEKDQQGDQKEELCVDGDDDVLEGGPGDEDMPDSGAVLAHEPECVDPAGQPPDDSPQEGSKAAHITHEAEMHDAADMPAEHIMVDDDDNDPDMNGEQNEDTHSVQPAEAENSEEAEHTAAAEAEEEEYDEEPFLGEEPSEIQEDSVAAAAEEDELQPEQGQDEPHTTDGDARHLTTEAEQSPEQDKRITPRNRGVRRGSDHSASVAEPKSRSSLSGSEAGRRSSERRRGGPQAPIVWQPAAASKSPKTLFNHHQRVLNDPNNVEKQDFGGAVRRYDGRKLVVSISSEYAIGLRRPPRGKPKRHVEFAAGQFQLKSCPELPHEEDRVPLQLSRRSSSSSGRNRGAPKWNRRVKFTGELPKNEKVEYVHHGDCIKVQMMNLPSNFWYSQTVARRFVIDPAEFDTDYQKGVAKVEKGIAARPEAWKEAWINRNISRFVRAQALRSFLTSYSFVKPAAYYHHFVSLCKNMQKQHPQIPRCDSEKAYERGCARTVGCASAVTFKMLTALPKDTIGDIMRALGMELCTPEFVSGKEGVDDRLQALIKTHCPAHLFWKIICCKGGSAPPQRAKPEPATSPEQIDLTHTEREPTHRASEPVADSTCDYRQRVQSTAACQNAARYERDSGCKPDKHGRDYQCTDTHSAVPQQGTRWTDQHAARLGERNRSRPRSPVPLKRTPNPLDRTVGARPHGWGAKEVKASAHVDLRDDDGAGWVHGARGAAGAARDNKQPLQEGREQFSSRNRNKWPADLSAARGGQRGGVSDPARYEMDSLPAQKYRPDRTEAGFRPKAHRLDRDLQPLQQSGRQTQGGFMHPQENHDSVRGTVPARGDTCMRRGLAEDSGHFGGAHKRSGAAQVPLMHGEHGQRVPVATMRDPELGNMRGRVSVDLHSMSPVVDVETEQHRFTAHRQTGMMLRQGTGDTYAHDMLPSRVRQREVVHVEDERMPGPPRIDSRGMLPQRAHVPERTLVPAASRPTVYSSVQEPVPAAQSYDANQFQAAVTQAVQEVVKRLGVPVPGAVPDAAAAAAVQDLHAAPRAGGRSFPAPVPVTDSRMLPDDERYGARSNIVGARMAHEHASQQSSYAEDDFRQGTRYTSHRQPAPEYGKRTRDVVPDDDMADVTPRYDMNSRAVKARCGDFQRSHRTDYEPGGERATRYPDVEIVPNVSIVSHQMDDEYPRPPTVQRGHGQRSGSAGRRFDTDQPQHGARVQNNEPERHGHGGRDAQHDEKQRGRRYQQEESQHDSGHDSGAMQQPQGARAVSGTQRTGSAAVGGFLNRSKPANDGSGAGKLADLPRRDQAGSPAQHTARALLAGSPIKPHAATPNNGDVHRPSRWSQPDRTEATANRVPVQQERQASDPDMRPGAPQRQPSAQQPERRMQQEAVQQQPRGRMQQEVVQQQPRGRMQQVDFQQQLGREQKSAQQPSHQAVSVDWHARYSGEPGTEAPHTSAAGVLSAAPAQHDMYMAAAAPGMHNQRNVGANGSNHVTHMHDGVMHTPEATPRMGGNKPMAAPQMYETTPVPVSKPATKLRSGGSRVASSARTAEGSNVLTAENEDAFAVGSCCFAVGDGCEQVDASGAVINSGVYTHELVSAAVAIAAESIQEGVHGRHSGPVDPKAILLQATNTSQASGAAAIMLGSLNPLTSMLSIAKMGDVGFLVLRPGASLCTTGDLEIISSWMPYDSKDHPGNDFSESYYVASRQLRGQGTWARDCHTATVLLQPSDIIVAGSDGLWDAVHFFGQSGLATRQLIRSLYLGEQLDPGQLAERLLLRAWGAVQEARSSTIMEHLPPFMEEVYQTRQQRRFPVMPEDDIAVVVSYVLQA